MIKESRKLETITLAIGIVLALGSLFWGSLSLSLGVCLGAIFSSINLRLLIWSWGALFQQSVEADSSSESAPVHVLPRFVLKYSFLFLGILLIVVGLRANPVGFCIGLSNVFLAVLCYSILPKNVEQNT